MGFHPDFTGRENARMNAALLGLNGPEIRRRLPEIRDFAELGDFFDRPVRTYSSGMVLRLAFAVATHADADVLIVDEALAVGDGYFQKKSIDRITEFHRRGGTLLFCSHALYYVALLCDTAIWLKNGEVAAQGAALPVVRRYEAFLQEKERALAHDELAAPASAAATTDGRRPARLTEVFVHDGSGYPRTEFAAGETLAVEIEFETDGSLPRLPRAHRRGPGGRRPGVRDGHAPRAVGAADGAPTAPAAPRRAGAAGRAGRVSRLRLPRRREGAPRPRRPHPEARLLGRVAGVRRGPRRAAPRLDGAGGGSARVGPPGRRGRRLVLSRALAFLAGDRPLDYGSRLSRLRWRRAAAARTVAEWDPKGPAAEAIAGAAVWMVVAEATALPVFGGPVPEPPPGRVLAAAAAAPGIHPSCTRSGSSRGRGWPPGPHSSEGEPAAVSREGGGFPADVSETVNTYIHTVT